MKADGDCFPVAFRLAREIEGAVLCHGSVIRHSDGFVHAHAWVEYVEDGMAWALDRSNGNDVLLPAGYYHYLGQAHDIRAYTRIEAALEAVRSGHYGPWLEAG